MQLTGGLVPTEGRVEVCVDGRWTGICDSEWNEQDAYVTCRALGYPSTGIIIQLMKINYDRVLFVSFCCYICLML